MQELHDMMKPEQHQEEISTRLLEKTLHERRVRDYFNEQIRMYLRTNHKWIWELDQKDLAEMTKDYNTKQRQVFMDQLLKAMQTNRWKPIKRIKEHNKSVLLNQLDD